MIKLLHDVKKYPAEELTFFEECGSIVLKCRQVLKWTYPVIYFNGDKLMKAGLYDLF